MNKTQLNNLNKTFKEPKTKGMTLKEDQIQINDHNIQFQTLEMVFMGLKMNMFHASWYCNKTGLTIIVTGTMKPDETIEMKKMIQSIQCHTENPEKTILGIKIPI